MKIVLEKGQDLYLTSDSHYNHKNICRGVSDWPEGRGTRDFQTLDEMNEAIVNGINNKVGENDYLIHFGDWSFGGFDSISEFRNLVKCKNIILFLGNHDHHIKRDKNGVRKLFKQVSSYDIVDIRKPNGSDTLKYQFVACHFPIASWDGLSNGVPHLHGHVHLPPHLKIHEGRAMDVGMDGNNMEPYRLNEVYSLLKGRPSKHLHLPKDHHSE